MRRRVCPKATVRLAVTAAVLTAGLMAQTATPPARPTGPDWRKIGGESIELSLASPAGGQVSQVWYSSDGATLYARTALGIFETTDFENWSVAVNPPGAQPLYPEKAIRPPESNAAIFSVTAARGLIFGAGRNLSRSDDGGRSWTNLTSNRGQSIIGPNPRSVAISPVDSAQLAVANDFGVWRTVDGGLTWTGLNTRLPNLTPRRILSTVSGVAGTRIQVDGVSPVLELPPGGSVWFPADSAEAATATAARQKYSAALGVDIRSTAISGAVVYAGAADGRIFASLDSGVTFNELPHRSGGPVEAIFVDPAQPSVALAAVGGSAGPHVLRTVNYGRNWDALDSSSLPNAAAHGITADRASNSVYVATDAGVFYGRADLNNATFPQTAWRNLTANLAQVPATDARLDPTGVQLYIALQGYGVYAAAAPHNNRGFKLVDTADYTQRPAAPGSLLSVLGPEVSSANAASLTYPVLSSAGGESQIQVPFEAAGSSVSLSLRTNSGGVVNLPLAMQPVSPAIMVSRDGVPMLIDADSQLPLDLRNPAHSNGRILVMATGLGRVRPDWPAGVLAPLQNSPAVVAAMSATLDGAQVQVSSATLAGGYVGFYLVELQLPAITNAGMLALSISANGVESNRVRIWVEP